MVGHGGSSAGSYLADSTSPIPSHCASIVATSTLRVLKGYLYFPSIIEDLSPATLWKMHPKKSPCAATEQHQTRMNILHRAVR